jgi:SAM-dependent methyltransferase
VNEWDAAAWSLAALAIGLRSDDSPLSAAAREVLAARGLPGRDELLSSGGITVAAEQLAGQAAAPLHLASAAVSGREAIWAENSDEALLAQGRASAQSSVMLREFLLGQMGDLASRLEAPGARMLDVGTGVGALAVTFAELEPNLHVVGLDVLDRAIDLARRTVAGSPAADRVTIRKQNVAELDEVAAYDLAWAPAPFVPEAALRPGLQRMSEALRSGGWLILGHGKFGDDPLNDALTRFKTIAFGGTPLDNPAAEALLTESGLTDVRTVPTPPGAPAITIGRRP